MQVLSDMIRRRCLASYLTTSLLCMSLRVVVADLSKYCNSDSAPVRGGACGSKLSMILEAVCKTGFAGYYKRSVPDHVQTELTQHQADMEMFLPKAQAQSFLKGGSIKKRSPMHQGIVCECCHNVCSIREMAEYCRDDSVGIHMTKKSAYKAVPEPRYARIGAAKMAQLQASRTAAGRSESLDLSGDRETEVGMGTDLVRREDGQLQGDSFYLRSLLAKGRYPQSP